MNVLRTCPRAIDRLLYFVRAREQAREQKELVGGPGPHSADPILARFRFCNINREHDAVTRWIAKNVRPKFVGQSRQFVVRHTIVCRVFNEPETLRRVVPMTDIGDAFSILREYQDGGARIMRGAYMVGAHGPRNKGVRVLDYYERALREAEQVPWEHCDSLAGVAERLMRIEGFAEFMANQICTDLRYTAHWAKAEDWGTFVLCGPGTRRGLDRFDAGRGKPPEKAFGNKPQPHYVERLQLIREELTPLVSPTVAGYFADPNNLANTFCEFDKFERALWSEKSTLRKYIA